MKKALIDTDIWLEIVRGVNPAVRMHANEYWATHGTFTLSVITVAEIVRGLVRQQRMDLLEQWRADVERLEILPLDYASGELAGELYARLESAGVPIGRLDPLIAATALRHQLVLVTGNVRHFQRIAELGYPLEIVNWREVG